VRAVAIEYAGDDLQRMLPTLRKLTRSVCPKAMPTGGRTLKADLRRARRAGHVRPEWSRCDEGDYADYNRAHRECLFESVSCVHDLYLLLLFVPGLPEPSAVKAVRTALFSSFT
jgi:hypothetical protein